MGLSIWHIVLFVVVVILLFGTSKLKNLGKDLGGAIKDFKDSVKDENQPKQLEHHKKDQVKAIENVSEKTVN
ncbi:Sec-independent protein translocase subunit TatA [Acinetobacter baumannii]|uniref:Sec-independent protein translocase subunit TatA n=1 Tax=Acinetobacter TaxID=469 RepID=UPI000CEBF3B2|nr:Sec-independent protein translocase subunit TatA [Acinetobacter indicus]MDC5100593.1 Sec-independent protein translocase subunit TatA [Acinetobacter baumannii]MDC5510941.1 Sec-independent protein translocase subunit TatA [Acinetobacter baumannii]